MKKIRTYESMANEICEDIMSVEACRLALLVLERDYCNSNMNYKEIEVVVLDRFSSLIRGFQKFHGVEYQWDEVQNKVVVQLVQWVLSGMISEPEDDDYEMGF